LPQKSKIFPIVKSGLHPRNKHLERYNFSQLTLACPELVKFVSINQYNNESIDFSDAEAVITLNKALLKYFYQIDKWNIPDNYLCPPIPGRADYIHYMADLLSSSNKNTLPQGKSITILDIGVGANCIYPLIGNREYGWQFVGSDIDPVAIKSAKQIISSNDILGKAIECRLQSSSSNIFSNILKAGEVFDMTICNPPFHSSLEEASAGTQRKWKNLGIKKEKETMLNFRGQNNELWYEGGEQTFVQNMIEQSAQFSTTCFWYSTLISKKENLLGVYNYLKKAKAVDIKTINMKQGQKASRVVAWTFLTQSQQSKWREERWMK